jgi:hypothetical protein
MNPTARSACAAAAGGGAERAGPHVHRKVDDRDSSVAAATIAITPTGDSVSMLRSRRVARPARSSHIFGVVPLDTSAWNPETAPHAMVMNANGNSLPANTGPVPSMNLRHRRHLERRHHEHDRDAEDHDRADFHERDR